MAERLARACPRRVDPDAYAAELAKLQRRQAKEEAREAKEKLKREEKKARAKMMEDAEGVEMVESQFDYERQNMLIEEFKSTSRKDLRFVVPQLQCTE